MKKTKTETVNRRAFLKASAAAGSGAVAAALLPATAVSGADEQSTTCDGKAKGYQLSQHVADYYRAAKV